MRGHVVGALERVGEVGGAVGDGPVEPRGEVAAHVGRGVLVQGQRRRGVLHEQRRDAHGQPTPARAPRPGFRTVTGGIPAARAAELDFALDPHRSHSGAKAKPDLWWPQGSRICKRARRTRRKGQRRSMDSPLRERLRWRNAHGEEVEQPATRATMARTAVAPERLDRRRLPRGRVPAGRHAAARRRPPRRGGRGGGSLRVSWWSATSASRNGPSTRSSSLGTAIATAAAYGWGSGSAYGPLPYVWVTIFAFYFFTRGAALVHLALMAAGVRARARAGGPGREPARRLDRHGVTLLVTGLFVVARPRPARAA